MKPNLLSSLFGAPKPPTRAQRRAKAALLRDLFDIKMKLEGAGFETRRFLHRNTDYLLLADTMEKVEISLKPSWLRIKAAAKKR